METLTVAAVIGEWGIAATAYSGSAGMPHSAPRHYKNHKGAPKCTHTIANHAAPTSRVKCSLGSVAAIIRECGVAATAFHVWLESRNQNMLGPIDLDVGRPQNRFLTL